MIKNLNTKNLARFGKLTMDIQVRFTRLKFSRWMVMYKNHGCRTVGNDISKNLARMLAGPFSSLKNRHPDLGR
jgi:hypothetical protein